VAESEDQPVSLDDLRRYLALDGLCRDPVFIIGSPRSGTTALGHALNRHPELWASKESYVLDQLYGKGRATKVWRHHRDRVNPSWLRAEKVGRAEFLGFLGLGVNAMYSSRSGGRRWVDPTPLNTPMVDDLAEMFPGASFVHLMRDGRLVVRSMGLFLGALETKKGPIPPNEAPAWTRSFKRACETWARYVDTALRFERANPERCLTIRNEEIVADPRSTFSRIHSFLGIADDQAPPTLFAGSRINSSFGGRSRPSDHDWRDWPQAKRRQFATIAGPVLVRAGYVTSDQLEGWASSGILEPTAQLRRD
jgi:hypothetical protein